MFILDDVDDFRDWLQRQNEKDTSRRDRLKKLADDHTASYHKSGDPRGPQVREQVRAEGGIQSVKDEVLWLTGKIEARTTILNEVKIGGK